VPLLLASRTDYFRGLAFATITVATVLVTRLLGFPVAFLRYLQDGFKVPPAALCLALPCPSSSAWRRSRITKRHWSAFTVAIRPVPAPSYGRSIRDRHRPNYEGDIRNGGRTIILTLSEAAWVAAGATFDAARQDIIDGLVAAGSPPSGWNNVARPAIPVENVVRITDTFFLQVVGVAANTNGGSSASRTIDPPGGIVAGDLLLVFWYVAGSNSANWPVGWNLIYQLSNGPMVHNEVYRKADDTTAPLGQLHQQGRQLAGRKCPCCIDGPLQILLGHCRYTLTILLRHGIATLQHSLQCRQAHGHGAVGRILPGVAHIFEHVTEVVVELEGHAAVPAVLPRHIDVPVLPGGPYL
jgi:hypothetical protein